MRQARSISHPPKAMKAKPTRPTKRVAPKPIKKRENATRVRLRFQRARKPMAQKRRRAAITSQASGATAMLFLPFLEMRFWETT